jgi:DNA-binding CsgD family transcriptional regulator
MFQWSTNLEGCSIKMPQKYQTKEGRYRDDSSINSIGRFSVDEQVFKVILFKDNCNLSEAADDYHEIVRFTVRGRTLAIVEEVRAAELDGETQNMIARLTGRELQIAAMIAQGDATKNVAFKLRISEWTVGTHLRRIFAKLNVDNRAAMVYRCASLIDNVPQTSPKTQRTPASVD